MRRKHKNIPIEVETRTLDEVKEVLQFLETDKHSLVKRLMLDNMTKLDSSAPGICVLCMLTLILYRKCNVNFGLGFCKHLVYRPQYLHLFRALAMALCPHLACFQTAPHACLRHSPLWLLFTIKTSGFAENDLQLSHAGGVDVSMLKEAVKLVNGKVDTEASGNVTIDTVRAIAESGVTFISCGALTHSFQALDISLKIALL